MMEYRITCNRVENGAIVDRGPTWSVKSFEEAVEEIRHYYESRLNDDCTFLVEARDVPEWNAVAAYTIGTWLDDMDEDFGK